MRCGEGGGGDRGDGVGVGELGLGVGVGHFVGRLGGGGRWVWVSWVVEVLEGDRDGRSDEGSTAGMERKLERSLYGFAEGAGGCLLWDLNGACMRVPMMAVRHFGESNGRGCFVCM